MPPDVIIRTKSVIRITVKARLASVSGSTRGELSTKALSAPAPRAPPRGDGTPRKKPYMSDSPNAVFKCGNLALFFACRIKKMAKSAIKSMNRSIARVETIHRNA